MEFAMSNDVATDGGIKMLVYGQSGMGKTILAATCPGPLILSAESGLLSLKKTNLERIFGVNNPSICYNVPAILIRSVQDLSDAFQWVTESPHAKDIQTVIMDSSSEIAEQILANALSKVKDPRQAYGELLNQMITTIKDFRDVKDKNVLVTAKMEQDKDEITGAMMFQPMMPGKKVGPQLPYLFDEVFRIGKAKNPDNSEYRFLQTDGDMQYVAKDRSGALDKIEYPHIGAIIAKIRAG